MRISTPHGGEGVVVPSVGRERGFSLVEILVSLGLIGVMVAFCWSVWDDGIRLIGAAGRALSTPSFTATAACLRRDVQAAKTVDGADDGWTSRPLELEGAGSVVRYRLRSGRLIRELRADDGRSLGTRPLVSDVDRWAWRVAAPGLVELRIVRWVHADPSPADRSPATNSEAVRRTETLVLAQRGRQGGRSW